MTRASILSCLSLLAAASFALCANRLSAAEPDGLAALREMAKADDRLDRMIGQTIMVGFSGQSEHDPGVKAVRDQLAKGLIGGVVLYPENIGSARQLRLLTAYLLNANSTLVPFIAVDQEGGRVQRLDRRTGHTHYPSAQKMGRDATLTPEEARRIYGGMAKELAGAGINLNFGPVVDLSLNPWNAVIARRKRSYGSDAATVTSLARSFIAAHREANVATVAKHFPGHGSSWSDSHKSLPDISRSWQESELEPYVALAHDGLLDMVMVGHLYHPRFSDGDKLPSSLSANAIKRSRRRLYRLQAAWWSATTWRWARCAITIHSRIAWLERSMPASICSCSPTSSRATPTLASSCTRSSLRPCATAASRVRGSRLPMSASPRSSAA